jgi:glycosyltransferase involved in cell wall biosynthesis
MRSHANVRVALIGCRNASESNEVRRYAAERGIAERVEAIEYRTDMPNVLAACDLVVDASWAGTGITGTIREGMAMEKPVIATDCGGNGELVSSPDVGWLIAPRDGTARAGAIDDVIGNPDRAAVVGNNARAHVVRGFSKDLRISKLESLYATVSGDRPAGRSKA